MKYESTILKRLIDTYGVVGNPRYISEIIKEFIVRGKECFPNLFTYQADWLAHIDEFGLNPSYTVSYTGQSIYAPNTLERPVKSAILTGQTLVNISIIKEYSFSSTQKQIKCYNNEMIKTNTEYTIIYDITDTNNLGSVMLDFFGNTPLPITLGSHKIKLTTLTSLKNNSNMYISGGFVGVVDNIMIIEGDYTNQDIPYFEGMQSVKMPVLTTSNEDGTKTNILTVNEDVTLRSNGDVYDELNLLTGRLTQRIDENNEVLAQEVVKTVDLSILDQNGQNVKQLMSFNGGTHFNTTSLEGSPLPVVSVSVETDLEEILMMCSLEGNTL